MFSGKSDSRLTINQSFLTLYRDEKIIPFFDLIATTPGSQAVGLAGFQNSAATLISVGGVAMPVQSVQQNNFAVLLAPADTVAAPGQTPAFADVVLQFVAGYRTNHPTAVRGLTTRIELEVGSISGHAAGEAVDFAVRGLVRQPRLDLGRGPDELKQWRSLDTKLCD